MVVYFEKPRQNALKKDKKRVALGNIQNVYDCDKETSLFYQLYHV